MYSLNTIFVKFLHVSTIFIIFSIFRIECLMVPSLARKKTFHKIWLVRAARDTSNFQTDHCLLIVATVYNSTIADTA